MQNDGDSSTVNPIIKDDLRNALLHDDEQQPRKFSSTSSRIENTKEQISLLFQGGPRLSISSTSTVTTSFEIEECELTSRSDDDLLESPKGDKDSSSSSSGHEKPLPNMWSLGKESFLS